MKYFFPSPLININCKANILPELECNFDSGKSALRFILRSYNLSKGSKVVIPAYVCDDVKNSVEIEGLIPILCDLKNDQTFWTDYNFEFILSQNVKVIILVHLYGFIHPDTKRISEFCKSNSIKLIHDAAQSYGCSLYDIRNTNAILYSCGPGKSTSAAQGAWVKNINEFTYASGVKKIPFWKFKNLKSKLYLKSRIVGYKFSFLDALSQQIASYIPFKAMEIAGMCSFQLEKISYLLSNFEQIKKSRIVNYNFFKAIRNENFKIAYDDNNGQYFKVVLFCEKMNFFKTYLKKCDVPYYNLINDTSNYESHLVNFKKQANSFIEISCEMSLPLSEINRVVLILSEYK